MARYEHLPIYQAALDQTVHFEKVVAKRYRGQAFAVTAIELAG